MNIYTYVIAAGQYLLSSPPPSLSVKDGFLLESSLFNSSEGVRLTTSGKGLYIQIKDFKTLTLEGYAVLAQTFPHSIQRMSEREFSTTRLFQRNGNTFSSYKLSDVSDVFLI